MILIADSGATKTDWGFGDSLIGFQTVHTEGINPFHQQENSIKDIITDQLIPQLSCRDEEISHIHFYGAGCTPEKSSLLVKCLTTIFKNARHVEVESDLLGAARALCKHSKGIACILGTGSNSCLYDGKKIIDHIPPLGYILGDEGSGACLGKNFISDCLKRRLPHDLLEGLMKEYQLTYADILDRVYRQPQANLFLAGFTPYIYTQRRRPEVHRFLLECFSIFFRRNVYLYGNEWPVSFIGSIAWYFQDEIKECAAQEGFTTALFIKSPINELANYHFANIHL